MTSPLSSLLSSLLSTVWQWMIGVGDKQIKSRWSCFHLLLLFFHHLHMELETNLSPFSSNYGRKQPASVNRCWCRACSGGFVLSLVTYWLNELTEWLLPEVQHCIKLRSTSVLHSQSSSVILMSILIICRVKVVPWVLFTPIFTVDPPALIFRFASELVSMFSIETLKVCCHILWHYRP